MKHLTETQAVGVVRGGRLIIAPATRTRLIEDVARFDDCPVTLTIERKRAHRSLAANNYYWFLLDLIEREKGQGADSLHDFFKKRFLSKIEMVINRNTGQVFEEVVPGSTADLYVGPFYDYVEKVRLFCAEELELTTPDPNPDYYFERQAAELQVAEQKALGPAEDAA